MSEENLYGRIIESIFLAKYTPGAEEIEFARSDLVDHAKQLGLPLPKNLGDLVYSFRYRNPLPKSVRSKAPRGREWIIGSSGRSRYRFRAVEFSEFVPNVQLASIKIPDATPGLVSLYALSDEQALLARIRYNRLIDVFSGVACYSLQSHLRTTVPGIGQIETDEIYVGVDGHGVHYVLPVQAKGKKDRVGLVQIEQDVEMSRHKFPGLVCRPIGAQFLTDHVIALFEFQLTGDGLRIAREKH